MRLAGPGPPCDDAEALEQRVGGRHLLPVGSRALLPRRKESLQGVSRSVRVNAFRGRKPFPDGLRDLHLKTPVTAQIETVLLKHHGGIVVRANRQPPKAFPPFRQLREPDAGKRLRLPPGLPRPIRQVQAGVAFLKGLADRHQRVPEPGLPAANPLAEAVRQGLVNGLRGFTLADGTENRAHTVTSCPSNRASRANRASRSGPHAWIPVSRPGAMPLRYR